LSIPDAGFQFLIRDFVNRKTSLSAFYGPNTFRGRQSGYASQVRGDLQYLRSRGSEQIAAGSLDMSRAGVSSDHAERVMGHAIPGVEGVYDRYAYADEKARALKQLASLVGQILDPTKAGVVRLDERRRKSKTRRG